MKLQRPENENYAATVVRLTSINKLEGSDNIVGTPIFGFQAIVSKKSKVGDIGIVLPAETQLSEKYASENNLFRHGDLNKDEGTAGYLEDNRRIRAMKFRGHRSDCLFMPLESLVFTKVDLSKLEVGDVFDQLGGEEICKKYVVKQRGTPRIERNKAKKFVRIDSKFLPEHYDSDNYWRNKDVIPEDRLIIVTQKLHGTSIRIGNTIVKRRLGLFESVLQRLGVRIATTEFDHVYGSRKVIKDVNNPNQNHFYSTDIWTEEGRKLDDIVPEGFVIYGELIGWTPENAPIQKNYTYNVPVGASDLYIYRIAQINSQGRVTDLAWDQLKEFCNDAGLKHVPELWRGPHQDFVVEDWMDQRFYDVLHGGHKNAVPLGDNKEIVDEGVCVRADGLAPYILKAKSPIFLQHESKMMDEEVLDMEAVGSEDV